MSINWNRWMNKKKGRIYFFYDVLKSSFIPCSFIFYHLFFISISYSLLHPLFHICVCIVHPPSRPPGPLSVSVCMCVSISSIFPFFLSTPPLLQHLFLLPSSFSPPFLLKKKKEEEKKKKELKHYTREFIFSWKLILLVRKRKRCHKKEKEEEK